MSERPTAAARPFALRRLWRLTMGELRFAARYGILALYGLLTVIYLLLLAWMAPSARPSAGSVVILTDPAAMGLFFMGAMVLLEKSQRVHCALAVTPVRVGEYIVAKALALMAVGLLVALAVGAAAGMRLSGILLSVSLGSILFTLLGMMVACYSASLNQFLLMSVPVEIVTLLPALFYGYGSLRSPLWLLNPGVATIALLGPDTALWLPAVLSLAVWNLLLYRVCRLVVQGYFRKLGGGKL